MSSRLDRLFLLIENGSNTGVRKAAAIQLGDVAKYYPREVGPLLNKLLELLASKSWDTRVAAGDAVSAIVKNIPDHELREANEEAKTAAVEAGYDEDKASVLYRFDDFDLNNLLESGARLYSSDEGVLIESERHVNTTSSRKEVMQQLGCGDYVGQETDQHTGTLKNMLEESDLVLHRSDKSPLHVTERSVERVMARVLKRSHSSPAAVEEAEAPPSKRPRPEEDTGRLLRRFLRMLLARLWDPGWEQRHGAATGLRELVRQPAVASLVGGAGLENTAVRVLCTLALDQVSDFISDDVVAPVRETCAQALGVLCRQLERERVLRLVRLLLLLCSRYQQWMVAQGGLLGIKYVLAATQDRLCQQLLPLVYRDIFHHLVYSHDEDVLAWSASTLDPVTDGLAAVLPRLDLRQLVRAAWSLLGKLVGSQEGLLSSAAVNSLMGLLCSLYSCPAIRDVIRERREKEEEEEEEQEEEVTLEGCLTLLIPYLYHGLDSVRISAVRTISILLLEELHGLKGGETSSSPLLSPVLLHPVMEQLFTCALLHDSQRMFEEIEKVWRALMDGIPPDALARACLWRVDVWLVLAMQPAHVPYSKDNYLNLPRQLCPSAPTQPDEASTVNSNGKDLEKTSYFLGGSQVQIEGSLEEREERVLNVRMQVTRLLGWLCERMARSQITDISPQGQSCAQYLFDTLFLLHLNGKLGLPRLVVSLVFFYWTDAVGQNVETSLPDPSCCSQFRQRAQACLSETIYYEEILPNFRRMQKLCRDLVVALSEMPGVTLDPSFTRPGQVLNLTRAEQLVGPVFSALPTTAREAASQAWTRAHAAVTSTSAQQSQLQLRVQAVLVSALVRWAWLPGKLSPLIRPLMDCLRREVSLPLQTVAAGALARLLALVIGGTEGGPNPCPKVVKNLSGYFIASWPWSCVWTEGEEAMVLTKVLAERASACNGRSRSNEENATSQDPFNEDLQQRGSRLAFEHICREFGDDLLKKLSSLWHLLFTQTCSLLDALQNVPNENIDDLLTNLRILEVCYTSLSIPLQIQVLSVLPNLFRALSHPDPRLRYQCSSVLSTMASVKVSECLNVVLEQLMPRLKSSADEFTRMGVIEAIFQIVKRLEMKILPYLILFLISCLESMTDNNVLVRFMTSQIFSTLIVYMPLEPSIADAEGMTKELSAKRIEKREFLSSLMDPHSIKRYAVPIRINAELRPYQQEGVNWLAFLNRYNIHGILCDDLGLGKTLQTICILAGDHYEKNQRWKKSRMEDEEEEEKVFPSLVVCPSTLTGHWLYEVEKFVPDERDLRPMLYAGSPDRRAELALKMDKYSLVIASYEIVRNDFHVFGNRQWNYCVLDEGHVIQNHKAKLSRCIRQLRCCHRLILSGTPIQNQVLELWSLFDFLMPGFLGTEQQFIGRYHRPVAQSKDPKATPRDQELGALALESLHRQVLPFMLRRMKEDVLSDLPPKIMQDYYCDLTPLQQRLYDLHSREQGAPLDAVEDAFGDDKDRSKQIHVFQTLQHLRKICNHPALVLNKGHPLFAECKKMIASDKQTIKSVELSGKLIALKQLLLDCGIGASSDSVVSQHRVLIFCQMRAVLDMVEELFKLHLPSATYMRLDGSVNAADRYDIVLRFNSDPSIDCLLMTTSVGGLGLNLTGADTVIFLEHDWNPMKDLQAMDRAHRIGQKRVVNVYRILTRDTLEEKIMGLQKFKLSIANTVVNTENSSLSSMGTNHLLDLFEDQPQSSGAPSGKKQKSSNLKSFLDRMESMWIENQYENEYSMSEFVKKLGAS